LLKMSLTGDDGQPLFVALVNPKSGGNMGFQLLEKFKEILPPGTVYNLAEGGPQRALEEHRDRPNLRLIVCGGDGTVGWTLAHVMSQSFPAHGPPAIAIVPLGTGNDLSRSLNWGGKYRDKPLRKVLLDIAKANVAYMDRWNLQVSPSPEAGLSHSDVKLVSLICHASSSWTSCIRLVIA
jgi:diacylglycerol kinase (ATP)